MSSYDHNIEVESVKISSSGLSFVWGSDFGQAESDIANIYNGGYEN